MAEIVGWGGRKKYLLFQPLSPFLLCLCDSLCKPTRRNMSEGNVANLLIVFISRWWDTTFKVNLLAKAAKAKVNKWNYINLKCFCTKGNQMIRKQQSEKATYQMGESILRSYI